MISTPSSKVPTANLAVNKSRIKLYNTSGDMPTYYLQKGQEFQIELFNPTQDVVLAKIKLNDKNISQGGLILKPGQRIFLERYLDVAKKFMFDTYEVANTSEVKEAIVKNGYFKVEFFKELIPVRQYNTPIFLQGCFTNTAGYSGGYVHSTNSGSVPLAHTTYTTNGLNVGGVANNYYSSNIATMDSAISQSNLSFSNDRIAKGVLRSTKSLKSLKSIETGRVEEGSASDQKFKTVDKDFQYFPFHTIECKLLPVSQKLNTADDINVKRYCTNCGAKLNKDHKFCPSCGKKA